MSRDNKYEPRMPEYLKENLGLKENSRRSGSNSSKSRNRRRDEESGQRNRSQADKSRPKRPKKGAAASKSSSARASNKSNTSPKTDLNRGASNRQQNKDVKKNPKKTRSTPRENLQKETTSVRKDQASVQRERKSALNNNKSMDRKRRKLSKVGRKSFGSLLRTIIYLLGVFINFLVSGGNKNRYITSDRKKAMDFKFAKNTAIMFFAFLTLVLVVNLLSPTSKISVAENRELQQKPKFSISRLLDGQYASDYSKYISDQFIKRDSLIGVKARFDLFMGKKEINGVYIAKDGYLMEGFKKSDSASTEAKIAAINKFAGDNSKVKTTVMLVPNKVEIYKNLLPSNIPDDSQVEYISSVKKTLSSGVKLVELFSSFEKEKNNEQLYFKTDHHWTVDGAYIAYEEYCKVLNIEPTGINTMEKNLASNSFKGSLYYKNGAKIGNPDELYLYLNKDRDIPVVVKYYDDMKKVPSLYNSEKLKGRDPYEVFTGGNHTQIKIRTAVDTDRKLLVIKDSYANAMLPFLANSFSEINVIDLRYFAGSLEDVMHNNDITDVLVLYNINTFNTDASILNINE